MFFLLVKKIFSFKMLLLRLKLEKIFKLAIYIDALHKST